MSAELTTFQRCVLEFMRLTLNRLVYDDGLPLRMKRNTDENRLVVKIDKLLADDEKE